MPPHSKGVRRPCGYPEVQVFKKAGGSSMEAWPWEASHSPHPHQNTHTHGGGTQARIPGPFLQLLLKKISIAFSGDKIRTMKDYQS